MEQTRPFMGLLDADDQWEVRLGELLSSFHRRCSEVLAFHIIWTKMYVNVSTGISVKSSCSTPNVPQRMGFMIRISSLQGADALFLCGHESLLIHPMAAGTMRA